MTQQRQRFFLCYIQFWVSTKHEISFKSCACPSGLTEQHSMELIPFPIDRKSEPFLASERGSHDAPADEFDDDLEAELVDMQG